MKRFFSWLPLILLGFLAASCGQDGASSIFLSNRFLNIAHRGGGLLAPENTMVAFENAVEIGADAIEIDVQATSDGLIVCLHDPDVARTTNGSGQVQDLSLDELRKLDAGYWFTRDNGETYPYRGQGVVVPTLIDVFAAFGDRYFVVDIKQDDPPIVDEFLRILEDMGMTERIIVFSPLGNVLLEIRRKNPDVFTSFTQQELADFLLLHIYGETYQPPSKFLLVLADLVEDAVVERAKRHNIKLHAWTINVRSEMERSIDMDVDGIITDNPELLRTVVGELGL